MIEIFNYIFFVILAFLINLILRKNNFLINNTGQDHQTYTVDEKIPLSGGVLILIFFYYYYNSFDLRFLSYLTIFFLIGLLSDLNLIKSPIYRFIIQSLLILVLIFDLSITIQDIRIEYLNNFLDNKYFNIFFIFLCFSILLNGTNFMDGNNGLSIGYYLIILLIIFKLIEDQRINYEIKILYPFIVILLILLFFNLFNKLYIGDNGVYLLVIFCGYTLIDIYSKNPNISPYFIVNLLWYPAFETLFSILRKLNYGFSPMSPDTRHLHHMIFKVYNKKLNFKNKVSNSLTGVSINIYNFLILFSASMYLRETKIQVLCIFISVIIYSTLYFILKKNNLFKI